MTPDEHNKILSDMSEQYRRQYLDGVNYGFLIGVRVAIKIIQNDEIKDKIAALEKAIKEPML